MESQHSEGEGRKIKEFGQPWIHGRFEASLCYIILCLKKAHKGVLSMILLGWAVLGWAELQASILGITLDQVS